MHLLDPAPFGRILPAMVTPMKADGAVDFEAAQQLARQLVADGADGLVVNGTTGESPTTHMEEKVELVQAVKEVVDVPVISGAGSNDTAHTVRMVEQTQEAGADAVLVVAPYYSRPSQEGVFRHYKAVNDSADKPIIIYDVPGRTGLHIQLETYRRLAELDHVKAVKDATGDIAGAVRKRMETGLTWYSGDDGLFLPGMLLLPHLMPVWAFVGGCAQGASLVVALALIALRGHDSAETVVLSGVAQSFGYLIASLGPLMFGVLVQATGGHHVPLMVFTFVAFLQCVVAVVVGRPSKM